MMKNSNDINIPVYCWSTFGVYGDGSCPELKENIHCKKCPTYYDAGKYLFDREIPKKNRDEWARIYSKRKETAKTNTIFVVVFKLGSELFAMKTTFIQEFTEKTASPFGSVQEQRKIFRSCQYRWLTYSPCLSLDHIIGITGDTSLKTGEKTLRHMIVIAYNDERFVFSADEILGIQRISIDDMKEPPATVSKALNTNIESVFFPGWLNSGPVKR